MTACQSRFPYMITLAKAIQQGIYKRFSLPASIGVSGDKTTAKYAAKCAKPYGVYVVLPQQAADFLAAVPVTELCGIAHNIAYVLAEYGVHYCQDIKKIPKSTLQQRLGVMGVRIWYMCQGKDPAPVYTQIQRAKTMGHGKVLPPGTRSKEQIIYYLVHMAAKLASRLHQEGYYASVFIIAMRTPQKNWIKSTITHTVRYHIYESLVGMIQHFMRDKWQGEIISQVQITAAKLQVDEQLDLFAQQQQADLQRTIQEINTKYNKNVITYARILEPIK
jgi:DNA polymerase-4